MSGTVPSQLGKLTALGAFSTMCGSLAVQYHLLPDLTYLAPRKNVHVLARCIATDYS